MPVNVLRHGGGGGNIYFGLWYPVATGLLAVLVSLLFLKETKGRNLHTIE
jgi:hypothetical protein